MKLDGKVAIVTGSTKGIGRAMAVGLAKEGGRVVVNGRDAISGDEVVDEIRGAGGEAIFVKADNSIEDEVKHLIAATEQEFGRVDVLINNAAAIEFLGGGGEAKIADQPTENFDYILKVNLYGAFWCCKYAIPVMQRGGGGSIINITSIASTMGQRTIPSYTCAKAALNGLTRQIAVDYAVDRIRCNAIVIGFVLSGTFAHVIAGSPEIKAKLDESNLSKMGSPEDIANLAAFLASEDSAFINGVLLPADGGLAVQSTMPDFTAVLGALTPAS